MPKNVWDNERSFDENAFSEKRNLGRHQNSLENLYPLRYAKVETQGKNNAGSKKFLSSVKILFNKGL